MPALRLNINMTAYHLEGVTRARKAIAGKARHAERKPARCVHLGEPNWCGIVVPIYARWLAQHVARKGGCLLNKSDAGS